MPVHPLATLLLLAQVSRVFSGDPVDVPEQRALSRLSDPTASWAELGSAAVAFRARRAAPTDAEVGALARALDAAALEPEPGGRECSRERSGAWCGVTLGPCLSRAGYLLHAAGGLGARARPLEAGALAVMARQGGSARELARRLLADTGHPAAARALPWMLATRDWRCVQEAGWLLERMASLPPEVPPALVEAATASVYARSSLAAGLARRPEPWARAATLGLLRDGNAEVRLAALRSLQRGGPPGPEVLAAAQVLAFCDPFQAVQELARSVVLTHGLPRERPACPAPVARAVGLRVTSAAGEVELRGLPPEPPSAWPWPDPSLAARPRPLPDVAGHRVVFHDRGEWGGSLGVLVDGQEVGIGHDPILHAVAAVAWGDALVAISVNTWPMEGGLYRLSGDRGRTWALERLLSLPSGPVAWGVAGDTLFLALDSPGDWRPCPRAPGPVILAVTPDLAVSAVESAATACLWPEPAPVHP